jgi:stage V sporulation protein G
VKPNNGIIGFASLVINNGIYLSSIAIHKKLNSKGYRLTYPAKKASQGQLANIYHPINKETSLTIESAIFTKLKDVMTKANNSDRYNSNNSGKKAVLD